ncbi:IS66 family transposase zinc-finger binding domain-containing protein [Mesorhizobium sp. M1423]|uniref:IS66 family transposase zinc-finger binding domain-containing protein n=1 Tax=Mesorhizobium sp. M1423 TaxID=2957101 RepID=UPI00333C1381
MDPDQFELALEGHRKRYQRRREHHSAPWRTRKAQPKRGLLPDHPPRVGQVIDVDSPACGHCGGTLHSIGESVSEMLDYVPARLGAAPRRPKYACRPVGRRGTARPERSPMRSK